MKKRALLFNESFPDEGGKAKAAYEFLKDEDFDKELTNEICKVLTNSEERELFFYLRDEK